MLTRRFQPDYSNDWLNATLFRESIKCQEAFKRHHRMRLSVTWGFKKEMPMCGEYLNASVCSSAYCSFTAAIQRFKRGLKHYAHPKYFLAQFICRHRKTYIAPLKKVQTTSVSKLHQREIAGQLETCGSIEHNVRRFVKRRVVIIIFQLWTGLRIYLLNYFKRHFRAIRFGFCREKRYIKLWPLLVHGPLQYNTIIVTWHLKSGTPRIN